MPKTLIAESKFSRNQFLLLLLLTHAGFIFIGAATTLLGIIIPALSSRLNLNDAQSGMLFTVQYAGSLFGTVVSGYLWKRFGYLKILFVGLIAMAGGVCGLGWLDWQGVLMCVFFNGVGIGLTIPISNLLIAALNENRQAAALNILNFAWGFGALLCPTFFGLLGSQQDIRLPIIILCAFLLAASFCFLLFSEVSTAKKDTVASADDDSPHIDSKSIWQTTFALTTAILLFLYVGTESGLGGWISAYTLRLEAAKTTLWTPSIFAFWISFLLGRLFAPIGLKRFSSAVYVLANLTIAAFGIILLLTAAAQIFLITTGVIFIGIGLAPVFPTVLAEFTQRFGTEGARQANWLFIVSTLGGASLTWTIGFLSNNFGSLRSGFFLLLFCCLLMIALQSYLLFLKPRANH